MWGTPDPNEYHARKKCNRSYVSPDDSQVGIQWDGGRSYDPIVPSLISCITIFDIYGLKFSNLYVCSCLNGY